MKRLAFYRPGPCRALGSFIPDTPNVSGRSGEFFRAKRTSHIVDLPPYLVNCPFPQFFPVGHSGFSYGETEFPPSGIDAGPDFPYNEVERKRCFTKIRRTSYGRTGIQPPSAAIPEGQEADPAGAGGSAGGFQQIRLPLGERQLSLPLPWGAVFCSSPSPPLLPF